MKPICALMLAAALGAVGCTTTQRATTANPYTADGPLADGPAAKAPAEPALFGPAVSRVGDPKEIDESNYQDALRRMQSDLKRDGSATAKAGR